MSSTSQFLGRIMTNLRKVGEGFDNFFVEANETTGKVAAAWHKRALLRVLHHGSGYLEASQQHLYKLWFYTFLPRWTLITYLIFSGAWAVGE